MKNIHFSQEEKADLFDEIASHFYNSNFGQMSKADIELLMFKFYIEKMFAENRNADGSINYQRCSDYRISKELGITQQRVRNLKVRNQLVNPIEFDWQIALGKLINNARYDQRTGKVSINIPDPNLYLEIQNYIEEQGAFIEKKLNSKILELRAEYFVDLAVSLEPADNRKKIIMELKSLFKKSETVDSVFDERQVGKSLVDGAVNITTIAANLSSIISPENILAKSLFKLLLSN